MRIALPLLLLALAGCASLPEGPSVAVMPGAGKNFDQFAADDRACRAYASQSLGDDVNAAGTKNVATGAAVGTAVGAAAGATLGGHEGAGSGAAAGLLLGTAVGSGNASNVQRAAQRRYDIAYEQCMSAKGNRLPAAAGPAVIYRPARYRHGVIYEPAPVIVAPPPAYPAPYPAPYPPGASVPPPPPR